MAELERLKEVLRVAFLKMGIYKKADMAEFLGYRSTYFSEIINGKEKLNKNFLKNISEKLNVNINYILEGKGEMTKQQEAGDVSNSSGNVSIMNENNGHITYSNLKKEHTASIMETYLSRLKDRDEQVSMLINQNSKLIEQIDKLIDKLK